MKDDIRPQPPVFEEDTLDIKRYLQLLVHHKWIVIFSVVLFLLLGLIYSWKQTQKFTSHFDLYYKEAQNIDPLKEQPRHHAAMDKSYWLKVMQAPKTFQLVKDIAGLAHSSQQIASLYTVSPDKDSNIFRIEIKASDPSLILPLTHGFVAALNTLDQHNQQNSLRQKHVYLLEQIAFNKRRLDSLDQVILNASGDFDISQIETVEQLKATYERFRSNLKETEIELTFAQASRIHTERELQELNDTLFERSSFTEPLKVQLMNLHVQLARALTKYGEQHPVVKGTRENITHVEEMLSNGFEQNVTIQNLEANPLKRQLLSDAIELKIREMSLQAKINSLKSVMADLNIDYRQSPSEQGFYQVIREREGLLSKNEIQNKKLIDTELELRWINDSFFLIDEPQVPVAPAGMSLWVIMMAALIMGLGAAVGLVFVYDFIDDRIKLVSDFTSFYNIPVVGALRHRKKNNLLETFHKENQEEIYSMFEKELTGIRVNLNQLIRDERHNLIALSSPTRKDGKTLVLYLLGMEYARAGKKVLLVDCDTFIPGLSKYFNQEHSPGLQDHLLAEVPLEGLIQPTSTNRMFLLPAGTNPLRVKLLFDSLQMDQFINKVAASFDVVLFDTPALLFAPEVVELIKRVPVNLLITRIGHSSRKNIDLLLDKIRLLNKSLTGTILTDTRVVPMGSYYEKSYDNYDYYQGVKDQLPVPEAKKQKSLQRIINSFTVLTAVALLILLFNTRDVSMVDWSGELCPGYHLEQTLQKKQPAAFSHPARAEYSERIKQEVQDAARKQPAER